MANDEWNPTAGSFEEGARLLKTLVVKSCQEKLHMKGDALELVKNNIPSDFNNLNNKPKGCVQIEVKVTDNVSQGNYQIEIDADAETTGSRPQRPHYGYSVLSKGFPSADSFTGHVFLPSNPPNYRPWKEKIGEKVSMGPSTKGNYVLTGYMYNQYK